MYFLECADSSYYTGSTWDLNRRVKQHADGMGANYTARRLPIKLVYFEQYARVVDAYVREKQVQGWTHQKKSALIAGRDDDLHYLAKCINSTHHLKPAR